jgi:hypothetical protein
MVKVALSSTGPSQPPRAAVPDRPTLAPAPPRSATDVDHLLPAAQQAADRLAADQRPLTRAALADALRTAGHPVSSTRASHLLKILKDSSVRDLSGTPTP